MRKISMIALPIAIFVAGLLVGAFVLVNQTPAQASLPTQLEDGEGWTVETFIAVEFEPNKWEQLDQAGACITYWSIPDKDDPASVAVTVARKAQKIERDYPNLGARVIVCSGFTAFSPLSSGTAPAEVQVELESDE